MSSNTSQEHKKDKTKNNNNQFESLSNSAQYNSTKKMLTRVNIVTMFSFTIVGVIYILYYISNINKENVILTHKLNDLFNHRQTSNILINKMTVLNDQLDTNITKITEDNANIISSIKQLNDSINQLDQSLFGNDPKILKLMRDVDQANELSRAKDEEINQLFDKLQIDQYRNIIIGLRNQLAELIKEIQDINNEITENLEQTAMNKSRNSKEIEKLSKLKTEFEDIVKVFQIENVDLMQKEDSYRNEIIKKTHNMDVLRNKKNELKDIFRDLHGDILKIARNCDKKIQGEIDYEFRRIQNTVISMIEIDNV